MRTHGWTIAARLAYRSVRDESGCLLWLGARDGVGYGRMDVDGRQEGVHRLAWKETNGPIPNGAEVCHHCDVRHCIEDEHLFVGTHIENMADRDRKGRNVNKFGEDHGNAKLTGDLVRTIRASRTKLRIAAAEFGVSVSLISQVRNRQIWRHVE